MHFAVGNLFFDQMQSLGTRQELVDAFHKAADLQPTSQAYYEWGQAAHHLDEHNGELGSAKVTFTLAGASRLGCIAYLIDHTLQMRAHLFRNLTHRDVSDGLHGSNGINCGNFNTTVLFLLQNNVAG